MEYSFFLNLYPQYGHIRFLVSNDFIRISSILFMFIDLLHFSLYQVLIEAVENHMPQVIIIDEISTKLEAMAASTIAQRGIQLVATAHGVTIENLIMNPLLEMLVGGIQVICSYLTAFSLIIQVLWVMDISTNIAKDRDLKWNLDSPISCLKARSF